LVTTVDRELSLDTRRSIAIVRVDSASEMHDAMISRSASNDCVIMAAAVADFTLKASDEKLKRRDGPPELHFEPAVDVLADLVARRHEGQVIVGFAAETTDVERNAALKWQTKGVDLLVVNDVSANGAGFEYETNEVVLLSGDREPERISQRSKEEVSRSILARVATLLLQGAP
jgi:phosphopantothenoylcysteine decarboxylase/phosphopantothenate--cysteine ligase